MTCTPIVVTRGDVDLSAILESLRVVGEPLIWDNSQGLDLNVFGRFHAAIHETTSELVLFQDDDVIISDPRAIVESWDGPGIVVCNMPAAFRPGYMSTDSLMGFGSVCERSLVEKTFVRYGTYFEPDQLLMRECSRIFTMLNKCKWVDVPKQDLEIAFHESRMWKQPEHGPMRDESRRRALAVLEAERGLSGQSNPTA